MEAFTRALTKIMRRLRPTRNPPPVATAADPDWAACHGGDREGAIAACTRILNRASLSSRERTEAHAWRGQHFLNGGDFDRAIGDLDEAIRLDPTVANSYNNRGLCHAQKGNYDRAIGDFDEAIRLDSRHVLAYRCRGTAYGAKGDHDRAIADFDAAIR